MKNETMSPTGSENLFTNNAGLLLFGPSSKTLFRKSIEADTIKWYFGSKQLVLKELQPSVSSSKKIIPSKESPTDDASALNPMLLKTVIKSILKYLNLQDIKNCRSICQKWNSVVQPILRIRSKISLSIYKWNVTNDVPFFHPSNYMKRFSETLESLPFTAFKFYGNSEFPWTVSDLNEFFRLQKENVRELELINFCLANKDGQRVDSFDITPWISNSPITKANTKYHTKLDIVAYFDSPNVRLIMQSDVLANIKELNLSRCQINLQGQNKLHPIRLTLDKIAFFKNGSKVPAIVINDIADLSKVRHIDLEFLENKCQKNTTLSLGMTGRLNIDYLRLCEGITVTNWRKCKWTVNKMQCLQSFIDKTEMEIRELDLGQQEKLDISIMPKSIEKLTLCISNRRYLFCHKNIVLHNLNYLSLTLSANCFTIISQFVACPNLVVLHLQGSVDQLEIINSDWIPKGVKRLKLRHVLVNWVKGNNELKLEKLVLIDFSFRDVKKICSVLKETKVLIVHCHDGSQEYETILDFLEYLDLRKNWPFRQRIYVGPFDWAELSFENSLLVDYVDKEGKYYVFDNQIGQALDMDISEFKEFENIENND